jgi:hypothetical protein
MDSIGQRAGGLMWVGILVSRYSPHMIWRGITGDTRIRETDWTYLPKWCFFAAGLILQLPLTAIVWFMARQGGL